MARPRGRLRSLLRRVMYNIAHREWDLIEGYAEAYHGRHGFGVPIRERSRAIRYSQRYPCTLRRLDGLGWVLELNASVL